MGPEFGNAEGGEDLPVEGGRLPGELAAVLEAVRGFAGEAHPDVTLLPQPRQQVRVTACATTVDFGTGTGAEEGRGGD
ncbi:hypothetical protein GCM10010363_66320 [Streptomyces omiyaensis]|nr:hypothetical protein GCM10010363_66320 [Streptomyces omiyaensis]